MNKRQPKERQIAKRRIFIGFDHDDTDKVNGFLGLRNATIIWNSTMSESTVASIALTRNVSSELSERNTSIPHP